MREIIVPTTIGASMSDPIHAAQVAAFPSSMQLPLLLQACSIFAQERVLPLVILIRRHRKMRSRLGVIKHGAVRASHGLRQRQGSSRGLSW